MVKLVEYPTIKTSTTFTVTIDPCQISNFEGTVSPTSHSYAVDAALFTGFAYAFTQTNACGYTESIEVGGLPSFVTHNKGSKNFSVETNSLADTG